MSVEEFNRFLLKNGRSKTAVTQILSYLSEFKEYLGLRTPTKTVTNSNLLDIEDFVASLESAPKVSGNKHLWAFAYWFEYLGEKKLEKIVKMMRQDRIKRSPFKIAHFRGIKQETVDKLSSQGIENVLQMLDAGRTHDMRHQLSKKTGVPIEDILELVKLSDLSRIGAVRSVRARLYHDAGVDIPAKIAKWDSTEFQEMLLGFIEKSGFEGIAPLPKEVSNCIDDARKLPSIVEY